MTCHCISHVLAGETPQVMKEHSHVLRNVHIICKLLIFVFTLRSVCKVNTCEGQCACVCIVTRFIFKIFGDLLC
jgi:hypothetical protein